MDFILLKSLKTKINKKTGFQYIYFLQNSLIYNKKMFKESEEIQEIIPQQHGCCYRYPIKLQQDPSYVFLTYDGTILFFQSQKNLFCHHDREGNLLSQLQLPKSYSLAYTILFKEQINLILIKEKQHYHQQRKHYFMIKWNFKANKMVKIQLGDKEIRKDKQIFSYINGNIYCIITMEIQAIKRQFVLKQFIRKIKVFFFKSSEDLQNEPYKSELINVQNDEFFTNNYLARLYFFFRIDCKSSSLSPILNIETIDSINKSFLIIEKNQTEEVFFCHLEFPTLESIESRLGRQTSVNIALTEQNILHVNVCYIGFYATFLWEVKNDSMIYLSHSITKREQQVYQYQIDQCDQKQQFQYFLLKFKDSQQKQLKIKTVNCQISDLIKSEDKNLYILGSSPQSTSTMLSGKTFFNQNEIIISYTNENDQFKILLADLLEKMIDRCCEDLIQYVLQLLFQDTKIWRE